MKKEDWELLISDYHQARAHCLAILRLKTLHFTQLPWLLCGLAHIDPNKRIQVAQRALELWNASPSKQGHHPLTTEFFTREGELRMLAAGTPLTQLSVPFQHSIARLAFIPLCETSIENKHGRVALAKGLRQITPVSVSLANRAHMLAEWLQKGQITMTMLVRNFAVASSVAPFW